MRNKDLRAFVQEKATSLGAFVCPQVKINHCRIRRFMIVLRHKDIVTILVYFDVNVQLRVLKMVELSY